MSNPTRSASMGRIPVTSSRNAAVRKRPPYQSPTVLPYTDDRLRRELELGEGNQALRPKNT